MASRSKVGLALVLFCLLSVLWLTSSSMAGTNEIQLTSDPDCVAWGKDRIDCFARSTDNAIWHTWYDGNNWWAWESLGGTATSGPSVASWGVGHLDVFIKGTDNALWHKWTFNPSQGWSDWLSLGGVLTSDPDCVAWGKDRIDCFARTIDNAIWHKWYDVNWVTPGESLGGTATSGPSVASWGVGHLDVFIKGTDNALWHKWTFNPSQGWSDWLRLSMAAGLEGTSVSLFAPTAVTLPATDVTATSAVLHGTVNPNGLATKWDFANPPNTMIYCPAGAGNLPADNVVHDVSCTATGLTPSTHYEYMIRASNTAGLSGGSPVGFTTTATTQPATVGTDWAVLWVGLSPATPQVGDPVTFSMDMTALSSSKPSPQDVVVECQVDPPASAGGTECFFGTVTFPGPIGKAFTVTSKTPWSATPGMHTLMWDIATTSDPNPGNNAKTISFTVGQATATFQFDYRILVSPKEQTVRQGGSAVYTVSVNLVAGPAQDVALSLSGPADMMAAGMLSGAFNPSVGKPDPTFSSTLTITMTSSVSPGRFSMTVTGSGGGKTHTVTFDLVVLGNPATVTPPTSTSTSTTGTGGGPGFSDLTWIIIGILAVLIVIFAAFALRRRKPAYSPPSAQPSQPSPPTPAPGPKPSSLYCVHCGTENPPTNEFCGKCGKKLLYPNS